jgi:hypothetical protein
LSALFEADAASVPAESARRHSITCEEYRPPRRNSAVVPLSGAWSYSATILALYSAVNDRR